MAYKDKDKQREFQRLWKANRRARFIALYGGHCQFCNSDIDLEFHHFDRMTKLDHKIWSWRVSRIVVELGKCILLCRSCHEEETSKQFRLPLVHGTWQSYKRTYNPCRCNACRAANTAYEYTRRRLVNSLQDAGAAPATST